MFRLRAGSSFGSGVGAADWSFLPAPDRNGLAIGALHDGQRRLAHELIVTGTSLPGYAKVVSVMAMEHVLRALAPDLAKLFNPERYCFKVFGSPGDQAWGWQFAGHHVSLNFTVVEGRYISPTPCMLGAEPASYGMLAPLADDEELGYRLVNSLDAAQRRAAIIYHRPPPDLAARMVPRLGEVEWPDPVSRRAGLRDRRGRTRHPQLCPFQPQGRRGVRAEPAAVRYARGPGRGVRAAAARRGGRGPDARPGTRGHGQPHLRVGRRHFAWGAALLPGPRTHAAHRA